MVTTIIIPVSRPDFLHRIFAQLELMDCDPANTHIVVYIDGNMQLYEVASNLVRESRFANKKCIFRRKGLPNVGSVRGRRRRIADIHNELKGIVDHCDMVFLLEDDTLFPTNVMTKLLKTYSEHPYAGFVSAIEIGRWGFEMIGAWKVDDVYRTTKLVTIPLGQSIEEVDAAGLYCCMMKYDVYQKHKFEPFGDVLGPDVNMGLWLRQQGYKNYVDHSIRCKHLTKRGEITVEKATIVQVEIMKTDSGWSQRAL
jgi:hypothetical protein